MLLALDFLDELASFFNFYLFEGMHEFIPDDISTNKSLNNNFMDMASKPLFFKIPVLCVISLTDNTTVFLVSLKYSHGC